MTPAKTLRTRRFREGELRGCHTGEAWPLPAETALYSIENPVMYLHIPETIKKTTVDDFDSIAYGEADAKAAAAFAGE